MDDHQDVRRGLAHRDTDPPDLLRQARLGYGDPVLQNRVAVAESRLPEEVRRIGVTVRKSSPDILMVIHLSSSDGSRDPLYVSNYATLQVRDVLARLDGVGDV